VEWAFKESEEKYRTLVENSLTAIYADQVEKNIFSNTEFSGIYGYSRDEIIGMERWKRWDGLRQSWINSFSNLSSQF
jgi:PAS domain S-box-containing protein